MKRLLLLLIFSSFLEANYAQFIDFMLFKPRLTLDGEIVSPYQDSSLSYGKMGFNYLFPLKNKLDVKVDWRNLLTSGSIKEAITNVHPKAYQIFGNVGVYSQAFSMPETYGTVQTFKGGLSGIYVTIKKKKLRSIVFATSVRVTKNKHYSQNPGINPSVFIGKAFAKNFKNFWTIGAYASYYGNRFIGSPVVLQYHKFSKKWSSLLVLPVQGKLIYKASKKFEQSFAVSYFGDNFMLNKFTSPQDNGTYFTSGLRISTQSKIKLGKRKFLYLEAGWQDLSRSGKISGFTPQEITSYPGSVFGKLRLVIPLGKSLLNSDSFDFGL